MNWPILILAILFGWMQNAYFGWNWNPKSEGELVCDGIVIVLVALSMLRTTQ